MSREASAPCVRSTLGTEPELAVPSGLTTSGLSKVWSKVAYMVPFRPAALTTRSRVSSRIKGFLTYTTGKLMSRYESQPELTVKINSIVKSALIRVAKRRVKGAYEIRFVTKDSSYELVRIISPQWVSQNMSTQRLQ